MLVGNVISVSSLSTRFTTGSTGLNGKLFASGLKGIKTFLGPSGEVDVDGGSHASSKIGWARVNVTELFGQLEVLAGFSLDGVLYSLNTSGQSFEYTSYITSLLHGNDSELRNEYHQMYNVPPPTTAMLPFPPMNSPVTPVSLAFSHQSSSPPPPTPMSPPASSLSPASSTSSSPIDFRENCQVQDDIFSNKMMEPMRNSFYGEEANVWGPGLLGLFVKSPSQFETSENDSRPSADLDFRSSRKSKPHFFHFSNEVQSQKMFSPESETAPPGFEFNCSSNNLFREETFNGNRSM